MNPDLVTLSPARAGDMVAALGTPDFESVVGGYLLDTFDAAHVNLVRYRIGVSGHVDQVECLGSHGVYDPALVQRAWRNYLDRYWRDDPVCDYALGTPATRVFCRDLRRLRPRSYFDDCYVDGLREECTLLGQAGGDTYVLEVLRSEDAPPFVMAELSRLRALSSFLIPLVSRHALFCPARSASDADPACRFARALDGTGIQLSPRERAVCDGILRGDTLAALAEHLGIRPSTAETYADRAFRKLGVRSQHELLTWCLQHVPAAGDRRPANASLGS